MRVSMRAPHLPASKGSRRLRPEFARVGHVSAAVSVGGLRVRVAAVGGRSLDLLGGWERARGPSVSVAAIRGVPCRVLEG